MASVVRKQPVIKFSKLRIMPEFALGRTKLQAAPPAHLFSQEQRDEFVKKFEQPHLQQLIKDAKNHDHKSSYELLHECGRLLSFFSRRDAPKGGGTHKDGKWTTPKGETYRWEIKGDRYDRASHFGLDVNLPTVIAQQHFTYRDDSEKSKLFARCVELMMAEYHHKQYFDTTTMLGMVFCMDRPTILEMDVHRYLVEHVKDYGYDKTCQLQSRNCVMYKPIGYDGDATMENPEYRAAVADLLLQLRGRLDEKSLNVDQSHIS